MTQKLNLKLRGRTVREDADGFVCVNDIWTIAQSPKNRAPTDFSRLHQFKQILEALHTKLFDKSDGFKISRIWRSKNNPELGTYAHPIIALAYAEFLNPKLAIEVREVFLRAKSGDAKLADEILEEATPEDNEWAARRAIGRATRNQFTTELGKRGVKLGWQYGAITNETYTGLFDQNAKQMKQARDLPASGNLRDKMSIKELAFVAASDALSIERMEDEASNGFSECKVATSKATRALRSAIESDRKNRQKPLGV